jgi:hypothetical protein
MDIKEKEIISLIRDVYKNRLAEAVIKGTLEEADLYDDRGNMVISKDLKVKHKTSGYEYTVDHVEGEGEDAIIFLRHPEEPRINPADSELALYEKTKISLKGLDMNNIAGGQELDVDMPDTIDLEKDDLESKEPATMLSVPAKEFEKEYEVE